MITAGLAALIVVVLLALLRIGAAKRRQLERELEALRELARVDGPTALRNRDAFGEDLEHELLRAERTGRPATLAVIAQEGARGELTGRGLADSIGRELRTVDLGYRIGTEEFALILPDTRALAGVRAIERVALALRSGSDPCAIRAGIAELGPGIDRHQLFRNAYAALLACGRDGRPSVVIYGPELPAPRAEGGLPVDPVDAIDGPAA